MSVSENERISEQFICFYPNILVEYVEKTEKVFDRPITIFEGRIEFDSDVIKNKIDKIIGEYEISFSLSEPEPEKMYLRIPANVQCAEKRETQKSTGQKRSIHERLEEKKQIVEQQPKKKKQRNGMEL